MGKNMMVLRPIMAGERMGQKIQSSTQARIAEIGLVLFSQELPILATRSRIFV